MRTSSRGNNDKLLACEPTGREQLPRGWQNKLWHTLNLGYYIVHLTLPSDYQHKCCQSFCEGEDTGKLLCLLGPARNTEGYMKTDQDLIY